MTARIAIIGAGGLGGPLAYALARAGAELTLCDHDTVELSNLHRQIQFRTADIGRQKTDALADELCRRGFPRRAVRSIPERFTAASADAVLAGATVAIDGSDDFATKFAVNDQALARRLPFVIASVLRYTGQIFALDPESRQNGRNSAMGCYRCLFEDVPGESDDAGTADPESCQGAGVLGAIVATIAGLAARAALALARGEGPLGQAGGALWVMSDLRRNPLDRALRAVRYAPRPDCPACCRLVQSPLLAKRS